MTLSLFNVNLFKASCKKSETFNAQFMRKLKKQSNLAHFWRLILLIWGLGIFSEKIKTSLSLFHCYTSLCKKIRKIECIVFKKNERTDRQTDGRTNGGEIIGPKSASGGGPKTI